nr:hypothetical protein [Pandoravirus massiliensis]
MTQRRRQDNTKETTGVGVASPRRSARLAAKNSPIIAANLQLTSLCDRQPKRAPSTGAPCQRQRSQTPRRHRAGARSNKKRAAHGDTETLPDEILWMILGDFMKPPWHAVAAQVSRRWRGVLLAWASHAPRGPSRSPLILCKSLMTYAISTNARSLAAWLRDACGCPMGAWCFDAAAAMYADRYEWWVRWLRACDPPCPWSRSAIADSITHTRGCALAQWMRDQSDPCPWDESACEAAVSVDAFAIRRREKAARRVPRARSRAKKAPKNNSTADGDAVGPAPSIPVCLAWLRTREPPCPWSARVCHLSAMYVDWSGMDVLRWLRAQNPPCPWDACTLNELARCASVADFVWALDAGALLNAHVAASAASKGRIDILTTILERLGDAQSPGGRGVWTPSACTWAGEAADPRQVVTWLRDVAKCPFDEEFTSMLARNDRIDTLLWAHASGMPIDAVRACHGAASCGSTRVLAWFRNGGCFDPERLFEAAARRSVEYDDTAALDRLVALMPDLNVARICSGYNYIGRKMRARLAALGAASHP